MLGVFRGCFAVGRSMDDESIGLLFRGFVLPEHGGVGCCWAGLGV